MPTEPDLTVRDVTVREASVFNRTGQAMRQTVLTFYAGVHGPFTFSWPQETWKPELARQAIENKVQELRAMLGGL